MPGKNQVEGKCDTDNIKAQNDHLPDKIVIKQEKQDNDEQLSVVNREHCESLAQVWIKEEQEEFNEHLIIKEEKDELEDKEECMEYEYNDSNTSLFADNLVIKPEIKSEEHAEEIYEDHVVEVDDPNDLTESGRFLSELNENICLNNDVDRKFCLEAYAAFSAGNYSELYAILESRAFGARFHGALQELWFKAHYAEAEKARGRPLGAVDKYRLRRKYPLPRTIWDGDQTVYNFKKKWRDHLNDAFRKDKYPDKEAKIKLSVITGLSLTQISNWFKNRRQRVRHPQPTRILPSV